MDGWRDRRMDGWVDGMMERRRDPTERRQPERTELCFSMAEKCAQTVCTNLLEHPLSHPRDRVRLGFAGSERTFEGGSALSFFLNPHPFAWKTPPHQAVSGLKESIFMFFLHDFWG